MQLKLEDIDICRLRDGARRHKKGAGWSVRQMAQAGAGRVRWAARGRENV
jgi:hypothetical protein